MSQNNFFGFTLAQLFEKDIHYNEQYNDLEVESTFNLKNYPYNLRRFVYRYYDEIVKAYPSFAKQLPRKTFNYIFTSDDDMKTIPRSLSSHLQTYYIFDSEDKYKEFLQSNPDWKDRFFVSTTDTPKYKYHFVVLKLNKYFEDDITYRSLTSVDKKHLDKHSITQPVMYVNQGTWQPNYLSINLLDDISLNENLNVFNIHGLILVGILETDILMKYLEYIPSDNKVLSVLASRFGDTNIIERLPKSSQLMFLTHWCQVVDVTKYIDSICKVLSSSSQSIYMMNELLTSVYTHNNNTIPTNIHESLFKVLSVAYIDPLLTFISKHPLTKDIPSNIIRSMNKEQQTRFMKQQNEYTESPDYNAIFDDESKDTFYYKLNISPEDPLERMKLYFTHIRASTCISFKYMMEDNMSLVPLYLTVLFSQLSEDVSVYQSFVSDLLKYSSSDFNKFIEYAFSNGKDVTTLFTEDVTTYITSHNTENINNNTYAMLYVKSFKQEPPLCMYHDPIVNIQFQTLSSIWRKYVSSDVVPMELTDKRYWTYMITHAGQKRSPNSTSIYTYFSNSTESKIIFVSDKSILDKPAVQRYTIPVAFDKIREFLTEELDTNNISMPGVINAHDWDMMTAGNSLIDCVVFTDKKDIYCNRTPLKKLLAFFTEAIELNFDVSVTQVNM